MPRRMREEMLRLEWNTSRKEIIESVRRNVRVKNQRRTTINNLGKATKFEIVMESITRKLKRLFKGEKAVHKQVRDLEKKIDETNRRRSKLIYLEQSMSQGLEESSPSEKVSLALSFSEHGSERSQNMSKEVGESAPSEKEPVVLSCSEHGSERSQNSMSLKESAPSEKVSLVLSCSDHGNEPFDNKMLLEESAPSAKASLVLSCSDHGSERS